MPCHGHHSLYVYPENSLSCHSTNVVYRPPYLNERLSPGEAKPRFWINPNSTINNQTMVSVAWCQLRQPKHLRAQQLSNTSESNRKQQTRTVQRTSHLIGDPAYEVNTDVNKTRSLTDQDHNMFVKMYPEFLVPYINKPVRIRLVFMDPKIEQLVGEYAHLKHNNDTNAEPMLETSHMIRNMHSLKVLLKYSSVVQGLPDILVEENHGGVKRLRRVRYRPMVVTWIDLDHRKPSIKIVGKQFELTLGPTCPSHKPEDFLDGNGETPFILGTYVRSLDTCPDRRLHFSARIYHWFNQSLPAECSSEINTNCLSWPDASLATSASRESSTQT